jgi:hypothetical protein
LLLFAGSPEGSKITIDPNWIHYRRGASEKVGEKVKELNVKKASHR